MDENQLRGSFDDFEDRDFLFQQFVRKLGQWHTLSRGERDQIGLYVGFEVYGQTDACFRPIEFAANAARKIDFSRHVVVIWKWACTHRSPIAVHFRKRFARVWSPYALK